MYILDNMIDLALGEGEKWTSKAHRKVAQRLLLCNSRITNRDHLMDLGQRINAVDSSYIKKFTLADAIKLGVPVN